MSTTSDQIAAFPSAANNAKLRLFIDIWRSHGAKYDPANAPDSSHPFYLNTLWLTYDEAMLVDACGINSVETVGAFSGSRAKTFYAPRATTGWSSLFDLESTWLNCTNVEAIQFGGIPHARTLINTFRGCTKLRDILTPITVAASIKINSQPFINCTALENFKLALKCNSDLILQWSPLLSLATMQYLVENAANTAAITVTVHPNVYAKLTDEANAQWHAVLTAAASKNISFATIES